MRAKFWASTMASLLAAATTLHAAIILNSPETFSLGVGNWGISSQPPVHGLGSPFLTQGTGGQSGDYLQYNAVNAGATPDFFDVVISNIVDYAGNYAIFGDALRLSFDFYASTTVPTYAQLFFNSGADQWTLDILPQISGTGWSTVGASFDSSGAGWFHQINGGSLFASSLTDVTAIGIFLVGTVGGNDTATFGIDNWVYTVPEPGSMAMLGAALLSMAATFRRPLQEKLAKKNASRE